jgi:hypothetical protein
MYPNHNKKKEKKSLVLTLEKYAHVYTSNILIISKIINVLMPIQGVE